MEGQKIERNYGLDLFKIFCMIFIIGYHFSEYGNVNINCSMPLTFGWNVLAIPRAIGGNFDCGFMLISGYFLYKSKFKAKTVFRLWLQVWFYSIVFGTVCYFLGTSFSMSNLITMLFPVTFNQYWYFSTYIVIYLFFPFFNKLIDSLNKEQHGWFVILGLVLTSVIPTLTRANWLIGTNSITLFVFLYFVGAYINKYKISVSKNKISMAVVIALLLEIVSVYAMRKVYELTGVDNFTYFVWGTQKTLTVATSVLLFLFFKDLKVKPSKLITFVSSSVFGVYLFHMSRLNTYIFPVIFDDSKTYDTFLILPQLIVAIVAIFIVGILIDRIRMIVFEKPVLKLLSKPIASIDSRMEKVYQ